MKAQHRKVRSHMVCNALLLVCSLAMHMETRAQMAATSPLLEQGPEVLLEDWNGLPIPFSRMVDGAVSLGNEHVMFFSGARCMIYDMKDHAHPYAPFAMMDSLQGWPKAWVGPISDAVELNDTINLIFRDSAYLIMDVRTYQVSGPFAFSGLPTDWNGKLNAVVRWSANQMLFFHGDEYVEWNLGDDTMSDNAKFASWPGWPKGWTSIDAAANPGYGMTYFFRGDQYMAYDLSLNGFVPGYPKRIGTK